MLLLSTKVVPDPVDVVLDVGVEVRHVSLAPAPAGHRQDALEVHVLVVANHKGRSGQSSAREAGA